MSSLLETQNGHLGIIQCTTESDPQSELALYRGDELVASTSGSRSLAGQRLRATPSYNSLKVEIREVVLEDEGTYVCSARNAYGNASNSMVFSAESECPSWAPLVKGNWPFQSRVVGERPRQAGRGTRSLCWQ